MRDAFRESPHYERTERFVYCYDDPAFDHTKERLSLSEFEPMVRKVFSQPRNSIYKAAIDTT